MITLPFDHFNHFMENGISSHFYLLDLLRRSMALLEPPEPPQEVIFLRAPVWGDDNLR